MTKTVKSVAIAAVLAVSVLFSAPAADACGHPGRCRLTAEMRTRIADTTAVYGPPSSGVWNYTLSRVDGVCTLVLNFN